MIEVFKTNIIDKKQASKVVHLIQKNFTGYKVNFDLEDCDNILRVEFMQGQIEIDCLIRLMKDYGCKAEVLIDAL